jgi:hypothetical protein
MAKAHAEVEKWYTPKQAAAVLGVPFYRLKQWRVQKIGPRYIKLGASDQSRVVYAAGDLAAWQAKQPRVQTEDSMVA